MSSGFQADSRGETRSIGDERDCKSVRSSARSRQDALEGSRKIKTFSWVGRSMRQTRAESIGQPRSGSQLQTTDGRVGAAGGSGDWTIGRSDEGVQ